MVAESLRRPYRVTLPMVSLVLLVPLYLFIPQLASNRPPHVFAIALDHRIPLQPAWVLVYGPLYLFLILLPLFVIRAQAPIRQTMHAYLAVWISAYVCFWIYPTIAPRPEDTVSGHGFAAISSYRVHRDLGTVAIACAVLVGISTLFTRQHYVLDVIAGMLPACLACAVFLRRLRAGAFPEVDRRVAPALALVVTTIVLVMGAGYGVLHLIDIAYNL